MVAMDTAREEGVWPVTSTGLGFSRSDPWDRKTALPLAVSTTGVIVLDVTDYIPVSLLSRC